MLDLMWAACTHAGRRRKTNQDRVLARSGVYVVADGMGGHTDGELASSLTVEAIAKIADQGRLTRPALIDAVRAVDAELRRLGADDPHGMGTTVCVLADLTDGTQACLGLLNVGDSRAYRFRNDVMTQLTHDHSVVQELIDAGELTPEQAEVHPDRHIITRSLGAEEHLDIDWWQLDPRQHDRYLLASDGLTREVSDAEIAHVLGRERDPDAATRALLDAALSAGGRDNISIVVIDVVHVAADPPDHSRDPLDADTRPRLEDPLDADTVPHS